MVNAILLNINLFTASGKCVIPATLFIHRIESNRKLIHCGFIPFMIGNIILFQISLNFFV